MLAKRAGAESVQKKRHNRHYTFNITGKNPYLYSDTVWTEAAELLNKDGYLTSWTIKVNGVMTKHYAEYARILSERTASGKEFSPADLKIVLSQTENVETFIKEMWE
jgi:hypothetical protein